MHRVDTFIHQIIGVSDTPLMPTVASVRECIQAYCATAPKDKVWLIGTEGCHLCETAYREYQMLAQRQSLPELCVLEVLDFDSKIMAIVAPHIPVLVGFDRLLVYPFGLLDMNAMV